MAGLVTDLRMWPTVCTEACSAVDASIASCTICCIWLQRRSVLQKLLASACRYIASAVVGAAQCSGSYRAVSRLQMEPVDSGGTRRQTHLDSHSDMIGYKYVDRHIDCFMGNLGGSSCSTVSALWSITGSVMKLAETGARDRSSS